MTAATTRPAGSAPTPPGHPGKLRTVEMGRGIAALAVVAFHVNAVSPFHGLGSSIWATPLRLGVDFFFVLSGFIIAYVHGGDIGHRDRAWRYLLKRVIRLYPLLWLVVSGWALLLTLLGHPPELAQIVTSLLLVPSGAEPIPLTVWTLRHEALFYLAFLVLVFDRKIGSVLFGTWGLAVLAQIGWTASGGSVEGVWAVVLSAYTLDFFIGMLVAAFVRRRKARFSWLLPVGVIAVLIYATSLFFGWYRPAAYNFAGWNEISAPLGGLAFAMVLMGMLSLEAKCRIPEVFILLGGASYAIYLVHLPLLWILPRFIAPLGDGTAHILLFAAASAAGVVVHLLFELPVTKALRNRLLPRRKPADA